MGLDCRSASARAFHSPSTWPDLVHNTWQRLLPDTLAISLFFMENQQVGSSQLVFTM